MCSNDRCHLANKKAIVKSDQVTLERCICGEYWLTTTGVAQQATDTERALAEIVDSLVRLKFPGAVPEGRGHV